jgi:hypothetical protein
MRFVAAVHRPFASRSSERVLRCRLQSVQDHFMRHRFLPFAADERYEASMLSLEEHRFIADLAAEERRRAATR